MKEMDTLKNPLPTRLVVRPVMLFRARLSWVSTGSRAETVSAFPKLHGALGGRNLQGSI